MGTDIDPQPGLVAVTITHMRRNAFAYGVVGAVAGARQG